MNRLVCLRHVSRFLGNDGVHRSVNAMRSRIGLLCLAWQHSSITLTCFPVHELACYHVAIHINNKFIHSWTFCMTALQWGPLRGQGTECSIWVSDCSTTMTPWHFNESTASRPSSKCSFDFTEHRKAEIPPHKSSFSLLWTRDSDAHKSIFTRLACSYPMGFGRL